MNFQGIYATRLHKSQEYYSQLYNLLVPYTLTGPGGCKIRTALNSSVSVVFNPFSNSNLCKFGRVLAWFPSMPDARCFIGATPNWKANFQNGRLEIFDLGSAFVLSVKYNVQYVFHLAKLIVKYKYIWVLSQLQQSDCLSYSPTILW